MEWLSQHSSSITAISNIGMLLVWFFYAQLLYLNFRRQRKPKIIVNRGGGRTLDSQCVISNMSSEAIFIEHIIAILHTDRGTYAKSMIDRDDTEILDKEHPQLAETTRQGPMAPGSYNSIGTFRKLIEQMLKIHDIPANGCQTTDGTELRAIEIRIVAIYGSEDAPLGALRKFEIKTESDRHILLPTTYDTRRYASRVQRHKVRGWIREMGK